MTTSRRAAIYLRVSLDQTGERLGIARHREECQRLIEQRGWEFIGEFVDNSISATDARKNRPGYDALVRAYADGKFDALVCYDLDRLTRQPRQLEDWIDAAEGRGLALVTANGEADLTTDAGRLFARIKAAVSRAEVERKAARQRLAARQRANMGRPPLGTKLTGYTAKGDLIPGEADIVRRIFKLFHNGESLKSVARILTAEGIGARNGKPWNPSTIRGILANPRYAGRAIYDGKVVEGVRGNWEPLVDDAVFDLVAARLADPRRKTSRVGTDRKHLGSGLYVCDDCGEPVSGWSGGRYRCKAACVNRAKPAVDKFVREVIAERLSRDDVADLLAPTERNVKPLLERVESLRARLATIDADYDAGVIDGLRHRSATDRVRAELEVAERELSSQRTGSALGELLATGNPSAAFLDAGLMSQRAVIDTLCTVRLRRGTRGSKVFDPNTVQIVWRE